MEVLPSTPVELLGLSEVPIPGDILLEHANEQSAKKIAQENLEKKKKGPNKNVTKSVSLDTLSKQITDQNIKKINLIIKTDVHGTLDALLLSINQIEIKDISINVLHSATGSINETDILLANTSNAIIIGFQVPLTADAKKANESANIDIRKAM